MKILIASDHAGFELKKQVVEFYSSISKSSLSHHDIEVVDFGPFDTNSVDYPDYANLVCRELAKLEDEQRRKYTSPYDTMLNLEVLGVLICGSGQGMAMRANKFSHVRAALVFNDDIARLSREHNNANVICLGSRFFNAEESIRWIELFKNTAFAGGRHQTRVAKLSSDPS